MYLVVTKTGIFLAKSFKKEKEGRKFYYTFYNVKKKNGVTIFRLKTSKKFVKAIIPAKNLEFSRRETNNYLNSEVPNK